MWFDEPEVETINRAPSTEVMADFMTSRIVPKGPDQFERFFVLTG